ncbi:MAG: hypothetical protein H0V92_05030 [Pseudonocardiales bacterium]|nr:hypothetical protein [Pseudonocardiales bacterium]
MGSPPIDAGQTLQTVLISPVVGGVIRVWDDDTDQHWFVDDPDRLASIMGNGIAARTEVEPDRYREACLFDRSTTTLLVKGRAGVGADGAGTDTEALPFRLEQADPDPVTNFLELGDRLGDAALNAARRGELIIVERGGWEHHPIPYVLAGVLVLADDATWVNHIEAAPAPSGAEHWPPAPAGEAGQTLSAPADESTVRVSGLFMATAIDTWGVQPWDIAITYTASPSGPWTS